MLNVLTDPNGLEQAVGESKRQDVLGRFLAEEVVDPEDLALGEGRVHGLVELLRVCRSVPNG